MNTYSSLLKRKVAWQNHATFRQSLFKIDYILIFNILTWFQGSSARLVIPASLGERRVWQEIQTLYMRFVRSEKSAPM